MNIGNPNAVDAHLFVDRNDSDVTLFSKGGTASIGWPIATRLIFTVS
jgi:hypothetical protein